jgi:hypothetical protein
MPPFSLHGQAIVGHGAATKDDILVDKHIISSNDLAA